MITWSQYGYPNFPDGMMRSCADDMGRYLAAVVGGELLSPSVQAEMLEPTPGIETPQDDGQGWMWAARDFKGRDLRGHSGYHFGTSSEMWFDVESGAGFVFVLNANPRWINEGKRHRIERRLLEFAEAATGSGQ